MLKSSALIVFNKSFFEYYSRIKSDNKNVYKPKKSIEEKEMEIIPR
jgi:hypothetical protein